MDRVKRIKRKLAEYGIDQFLIQYRWGWGNNPTNYDIEDCVAKGLIEGEGAIFVELPYTCSGDYIGELVQTANRNVLMKNYPDLIQIRSMAYYAESAIMPLVEFLKVFNPNHDYHSILDDLEGLHNYPLIDDDELSHLELEVQSSEWSSWGADEVKRELAKLVGLKGLDHGDFTDGLIDDLMAEGEFQSIVWDNGHSEGIGWYFDCDKIAELTMKDDSLRAIVIAAIDHESLVTDLRYGLADRMLVWEGLQYDPLKQEYRFSLEAVDYLVTPLEVYSGELGDPVYTFAPLDNEEVIGLLEAIDEVSHAE